MGQLEPTQGSTWNPSPLAFVQSVIPQLFGIPFPTSNLQSLFTGVCWFCPCWNYCSVHSTAFYCPVRSNISLVTAGVLRCTYLFVLFCIDKGYLNEVGSLISKESSALPSGTPAYFMSKNYSPRSYKYLQK